MTLRHLLLLSLVPVLSLLAMGCDLVGETPSSDDRFLSGVYVANQGNFDDGSGSVTIYDPASQQAQQGAVDNLRSIVQGIALEDTTLLVMANSGARVDVFSSNGPTQTAQVNGVNSPRYAAFTGPSTAYVTDQSPFQSALRPAVRVVALDASTPQVVSSIRVSGTPEGITVSGRHAYAALGAFGATTLVAKIDTRTNVLDREIDVGCAVREVVADGDGDVFALCTDAAEAAVLDAASGTVDTRLSLPDTAETTFGVGHPAAYSPGINELHIASDTGIIRVDTESNTVTTTLDVGLSGPPGAVGYSAAREALYVARVSGFATRGTVTIHDRDGTQTGSFDAGIAPTYIALQRNN